MDRNEMLSNLTDEQKAAVEKIEAILRDEKNQEKIASISEIDEIIAFFEENGIPYTDGQKEEIRKAAAELSASVSDGELTEDELASVAGGWNWDSFIGGGIGGAIVGGLIGTIAMVSYPVGWVVAAGAGVGVLVGGGTIGTITGLIG